MAPRTGAGRGKTPAALTSIPNIDLSGAGTVLGIAGLALVILSRLKTSAVVIVASVLLSVGSSLLAIHFLFGSYLVPTAYQADRAVTENLAATVAQIDTTLTSQMAEKFKLVDRNREDINLIVDQIGQQIDGFWIPVTFDIKKIRQGEDFILPIDSRHNVEMMIVANDREVNFLEKYLALYINKEPLKSLKPYINIPVPRKLSGSVFNEGQYGQTFRLKFRDDLSDRERVEYDYDLGLINHSGVSGQISVLMVIRRPILTKGSEENVPEPGSN